MTRRRHQAVGGLFIRAIHQVRNVGFPSLGVPLSPAKPTGVALLYVNLTGMLPPQIGASLTQVEATSRGQVRPTINVDAISGVIERSVSEGLDEWLSVVATAKFRAKNGRRPPSCHRSR
jgi:hypothetical protein